MDAIIASLNASHRDSYDDAPDVQHRDVKTSHKDIGSGVSKTPYDTQYAQASGRNTQGSTYEAPLTSSNTQGSTYEAPWASGTAQGSTYEAPRTSRTAQGSTYEAPRTTAHRSVYDTPRMSATGVVHGSYSHISTQRLFLDRPYPGCEDQKLEFKEGTYIFNKEDLIMKYICGFANSQGGKLVIGVNDKGIITGIEHTYELYQSILTNISNIGRKLNNPVYLTNIGTNIISLENSSKCLYELTIPKYDGLEPLLVKVSQTKYAHYYKVLNTLRCSLVDGKTEKLSLEERYGSSSITVTRDYGPRSHSPPPTRGYGPRSHSPPPTRGYGPP